MNISKKPRKCARGHKTLFVLGISEKTLKKKPFCRETLSSEQVSPLLSPKVVNLVAAKILFAYLKARATKFVHQSSADINFYAEGNESFSARFYDDLDILFIDSHMVVTRTIKFHLRVKN